MYKDTIGKVQNAIKTTMTIQEEEEALRNLCKQALKSRLFRGYYVERRYEESISAYRDVVLLQKTEKDLEQLLLEVKHKFTLFYEYTKKCKLWIGIREGPTKQKYTDVLDTCIWTNIDNLAFGQYWFSIKSIKYFQYEILIKLKTIRPVDTDLLRPYRPPTLLRSRQLTGEVEDAEIQVSHFLKDTSFKQEYGGLESNLCEKKDVSVIDFLNLFTIWATSCKVTIYEFLSNEITGRNLKETVRFLALLVVSLLTFLAVGIKHLGIFILRLIFEISRLTHALTPVTLKIIDVLSKVIGGFYILLSMMWRDLLGRSKLPAPPQANMPSIAAYRRPIWRENYEPLTYNKYQ